MADIVGAVGKTTRVTVELLFTITEPKMNSYKHKNHNNNINNNNSYNKTTSKYLDCDLIVINLIFPIFCIETIFDHIQDHNMPGLSVKYGRNGQWPMDNGRYALLY